MSNETNFDQLAWDYLTIPTLYRSVERQAVIKTGATIVFPLLRASLRYFEDYRLKDFKISLQKAKSNGIDEKLIYQTFIAITAASFVEDIIETVSNIGQPAWDAVCRALWEQNVGIKLYAALILFEADRLSVRTIRSIDDAIAFLDANEQSKSYFWNSGIQFILYLVLARGGNSKIEQFIQNFMNKSNIDIERYVNNSRLTTWGYLLNNGFLA